MNSPVQPLDVAVPDAWQVVIQHIVNSAQGVTRQRSAASDALAVTTKDACVQLYKAGWLAGYTAAERALKLAE